MKTARLAARCLACLLGFMPIAASARPFVISAGGTEVTDQATGLTWRRCAEGMVLLGVACTGTPSEMTHEAALQLVTAMKSTWRLPNVKELSSIVDRGFRNPAVDAAAFPFMPSRGFWSSTPYVYAPGNVWMVSFIDGGVGPFYRSYTGMVLLVRG